MQVAKRNRMLAMIFPNTRNYNAPIPQKVSSLREYKKIQSRLRRMSHKIIMWSLNFHMLRSSLRYKDYESLLDLWILPCSEADMTAGQARAKCRAEIIRHFGQKLRVLENSTIHFARTLILRFLTGSKIN